MLKVFHSVIFSNGDQIANEKKNVLVLHRFHPQEIYARDVALGLGNLHMDSVLIIESPRKRYFPRLLRKYEAYWALDLHDDMEHINWETEPFPLACVYTAYQDDRRKKNDIKYHILAKRAKTLLEDFREQTYGNRQFLNPAFFIIDNNTSLDPRALGIELYARRPLGQSVDFFKKLVNYLQSVSL